LLGSSRAHQDACVGVERDDFLQCDQPVFLRERDVERGQLRTQPLKELDRFTAVVGFSDDFMTA
jgi:hypothetical protein